MGEELGKLRAWRERNPERLVFSPWVAHAQDPPLLLRIVSRQLWGRSRVVRDTSNGNIISEVMAA